MFRGVRPWVVALLLLLALLAGYLHVSQLFIADSAWDIPIHDEYRVEVSIMGWVVPTLPLLLAALYLAIPGLVAGRTGRWLTTANALLTVLGILAALAPLWSTWLMMRDLRSEGYYGSRTFSEDLSSGSISNLDAMAVWFIVLGQVCFVVNASRLLLNRSGPRP